jgi:hypothetical protein
MTLDCESIIYLRGESGLFGETVAVAGEMPFSFAVVLDVTEFMQLPYIFHMNENCGDGHFFLASLPGAGYSAIQADCILEKHLHCNINQLDGLG